MVEPDNHIIKRCLKKDPRAQMQLYKTFNKRVYNSCYRLLRNRYEAEDAMQDSFIKAFNKLEQYDGSVAFETWLLRIAINTSIDKLREQKMELVEIKEEIYYPSEVEFNDPDETEIAAKAEQIKLAIYKMQGINQIILSLYLIEGYDHEEIAEILDIKAGTSRVKFMRAKRELIEILKNSE